MLGFRLLLSFGMLVSAATLDSQKDIFETKGSRHSTNWGISVKWKES